MAKAERTFKLPKWLAVLLWVVAILGAYVGTSWWWHQTGKWNAWAFGNTEGSADPFADPTAIPKSIVAFGDRAFYDFPDWYREITHPLRNRKDKKRRPYFRETEYPWYMGSAHLRAMGEPSLFERDESDKTEFFRFTLIPTFYAAQSFRVSKNLDSTIELQATQLDGQGGYYPGETRKQKTTILTNSEFKNLIAESRNPDFWKPITEMEEAYFSGLDGSIWIFESSTPSSQNAVLISNPYLKEDTPDYHKTGIESGYVRESYPYAKIGTRLLEKYGFPAFAGENLE
ncbi:MAG: hypothetical protein ACKVJU_14260 [Verrucomicrobiales bacterium]